MHDRQADFLPLQFSVLIQSNDCPDESFLVSGESLSKPKWTQALPGARFVNRLFRGRVPFLMIWIDDFVPHLAHKICRNVYNPHLESWELIFEDEDAKFIVLNKMATEKLPVNPHTEVITSGHLIDWHYKFNLYLVVATSPQINKSKTDYTFGLGVG